MAKLTLRGRLIAWILNWLDTPLAQYEIRLRNDPAKLSQTIRKGDVLLVDGRNRISGIIKYLTSSSWSHAALYIGDELLHTESPLAREWVARVGRAAACDALIEALPTGVTISPLDKYIDCNLRIARPHKLSAAHLKIILDEAIAAVGTRYDIGNLWMLARYMFPVTLVPKFLHNFALRFWAPKDHEVICSSLLGRLFNEVGFPVLPKVEQARKTHAVEREFGWLRGVIGRRNQYDYTGVFVMRDPDRLTPRDFDLSPYFEVVKFNVIASGQFDYRKIHWSQARSAPADGISGSAPSRATRDADRSASKPTDR